MHPAVAIAVLAGIGALLYGYGANVVWVASSMPETWDGISPRYVFHVIAIFIPPVGTVLGWFTP
jgi:hypothetical protein